jgi:hypothetical protein
MSAARASTASRQYPEKVWPESPAFGTPIATSNGGSSASICCGAAEIDRPTGAPDRFGLKGGPARNATGGRARAIFERNLQVVLSKHVQEAANRTLENSYWRVFALFSTEKSSQRPRKTAVLRRRIHL